MVLVSAAWPISAQVGPTVGGTTPSDGSLLAELTFINVVFDRAVTGVDAADLLVNGLPASSVTTNNPNFYTFYFGQPADGPVEVSWAAGHGITDTTPQLNPLVTAPWSYTLDSKLALDAKFLISEFMADNAQGIIVDEDGTKSDWIEISNGGTQPAPLDGWFLTDNATNLTKWQFPVGMTRWSS